MKYLRYMGQFVSRAGAVWRVEIMQEADTDFSSVGGLDFDVEPLTIEWKREDKEKVICGSSATLRIISPGDRTYEDLYSIEVGRIRMDVYKDSVLYWSGTLDPEFYEEPYESARGYVVQLTFSDFGVLDRVKYDLTGIRTLREIVEYALNRTGIAHAGINTDYVSTSVSRTGGTIAGGVLSVRSENFIDEDGESATMEEVIEGILQPLALRIVQRAGVVYLYDINGLYTSGRAAEIVWDGDSQTLGVDKVANNVTVSFSPYSSAKLQTGDIKYGGKYDIEHTNLTSSSVGSAEYGDYYSYYPDYSDEHRQGSNWDYNLIDFTIFTHQKGGGLQSIGSSCKYFHILPVTGGAAECSGVAYAFRTGGHGGINTGWPKWKVNNGVPRASLSGATGEILTTNRVFIPKLDATAAKNYKVRLVEEILIDARYNPFSGSTNGNDDGNDGVLKVCSGFVFIPAKVTLYDSDGKALYHYSNREAAAGATKGHLGYSKGKWVAGADPGGDCWLEYYNPNDLGEDAGVRGWHGNRHCIGRPDGRGGRMKAEIYDSFKKMADGEYMPYPPVAGYLEIKVQSGLFGYDYGQKADNCEFGSNVSQWDRKGIYGLLRWCLYKAPKVDVVNNNLVFNDAELEDVEYSGYVNKSAKEEISIDTICGTSTAVCPTAKGIYCLTATGQQIQKLARAGREDHPEKLLIGTIYSQYAGRKITLSGEAQINDGLHYYTEANQGDKRFMLMEDAQNIITDCTDAEYCEIRPDEYDSIEEIIK